MTKILSLLALVAALTTVSAPSFANEDEFMTPNDSQVESNNPDAARPPRWNNDWRHRRNFVCYARNATGRTFAAYGNFRMPRWSVQQRALQACHRGSFFILRNTCRSIGCR